MVITVSPIGNVLRQQCRNFPGLIGNMTIDWIFPWHEEALKFVAKGYLAENKRVTDFKRSLTDYFNHSNFISDSRSHERSNK